MSSSTTNLGLTLPADGERLSLGVLNQNWNTVDGFAGMKGKHITATGATADAIISSLVQSVDGAFNLSGYSLGATFNGSLNWSGVTYASYTITKVTSGAVFVVISSSSRNISGYCTIVGYTVTNVFDLNSQIARTQLAVTRTENNYASATEVARCTAHRCGKALIFIFNCSLSGANMSDFVEIGSISGWSASNDVFQTVMPQNGESKPVIVQITAAGKVKIYGSQGTAYSFYRCNLTAPEY